MTEKEKAKKGMLYNNNYDKELIKERIDCQKKCQKYNMIPVDAIEERRRLIRDIIGEIGTGFCIEQPFHCDYGYNIQIGKNFYSNYNLVILDEAKVIIGDYVFIAPDCGIYTAGHPINVQQRNEGLEYARSVVIGNNVWIGGGVKIMPGVMIGDNSVIGSGSVVTKDIPSGVIAAGNPCKVIREIDDNDLLNQ
ncbi:MAG TPA: sugar O-acetyltransferase [Candidatus Scybalomonas excrementigallinarum]|nr:sugar O-acetyltransferase [Candidatus Scybalomonas excrementigallinarum]